LELERNSLPIDALWKITQQINAHPLKGAGPSFIDYASDLPPEASAFFPENIFVNYFGRAGTALSLLSRSREQPLFRSAQQYKEKFRHKQLSSEYTRPGVSISVVENKLTFWWSFDEQLYHISTIEQLAQNSLHSLRSIIQCGAAHFHR
jgi:hypothetical protein